MLKPIPLLDVSKALQAYGIGGTHSAINHLADGTVMVRLFSADCLPTITANAKAALDAVGIVYEDRTRPAHGHSTLICTGIKEEK